MKKAIAVLCVLLMVFGISTANAQENKISSVSTVVGSYSHDSFVPHHLAVFGGELVVSDKDNHRLSIVDTGASKVVKTYGSYGENEDELRFPRGMAVNGKELLVCDSYNDRIVFLNTTFEQTYILSLNKSPKDICLLDGRLYILLADGVTVESYDVESKLYLRSFSLKHSAEHIAGIGTTILASGNGKVYAMDVESVNYEEKTELGRAHMVNTFGDSIYGLYAGIVCVYDKDYNLTDEFRVNGGTFIYPTAEGVYVADENKALVYLYKDGNISATYGNERKWGEPTRVSAIGTRVAVKIGEQIYIYKDGNVAASVVEKDAVDVLLRDNMLYVLNSNSITSYNIEDKGTGELTVKLAGKLDANSAYRFNAMEEHDGVIYICEEGSGKLLKVDTELRVFTTGINRLNSPKAVAVGGGRIYAAEQGRIGVYDIKGTFLGEIAGEYSAIAYNNGLYAINYGDKQISRFNDNLQQTEPLVYDGYFLGIADIEAREYGLYVCDFSRKEIMVFTDESLDISGSKVTVNGQEFSGTITRGQTLHIRVAGAGMINPLPGIGDVRYRPVYCGVDKEVAFKEDGGMFTADVSMPSVGNYTLKVKYQKQVYQAAGWQDVTAASGVVTSELPVTVIEGDSVSFDASGSVVEEILTAFKIVFGIN